MSNIVAAVVAWSCAEEPKRNRLVDTILGFVVLAVLVGILVAITMVFPQTTPRLAYLLTGQHVDQTEPGFTPPDLKLTVELTEGTTPLASSHAWTVATIENQGSGTLSPVVTFSVPSTQPITVRASHGFTCKSSMVPMYETLYRMVTCRGGLVSSSAPGWIAVGGVVPDGEGPYPVLVQASTRFGVQDANTDDNEFGAWISPRRR